MYSSQEQALSYVSSQTTVLLSSTPTASPQLAVTGVYDSPAPALTNP